MVELLAPAGDFESLKAAVLNGANAVYIGGKSFSARQYANNFDDEEMIEAVRFCHAYSVKLYVTMNTLLSNDELKGAVKYASFLYSIGIDGVIIQDIGLLKALRENLLNLEIHASTQMTVHNLEGVKLLYEMGVKRVVLSRELSLDEIKYITKNTPAEIEIFIHGALCICFSGQCLMSSIIGGRSGNRGRCAQPCRMQYSIDNGEKAYHLSPKDLSSLGFIKEVIDSGAASLKIEGRMKRPEYVATVVDAYRRAIDGFSKKDDIKNVTQIFNRGGFTTGYFYGRQGSKMMSPTRPKNWGTYLGKVIASKGKFASILIDEPLRVGDGVEIFNREKGAPVTSIRVNGKEADIANPGDIVSIYLEGAKKNDFIYKSLDSKLINKALESFKGKGIKKVPLAGKFNAHIGSPISLEIETNSINIKVYGDEPEMAIKVPTTKDRIIDSLTKTGDTPFYFENIDVEIDDGIAISASKLNALRRDAIDLLLDKLQNKKKSEDKDLKFNIYKKNTIPKLAVKTGRLDIAKASIDSGCKIVFFGGDDLRINSGDIYDVIEYSNGRAEVYPWYPEIILENWDKLAKQARELLDKGIKTSLCGNLGFYNYLKSIGSDVFLDKGFNIFNSYACNTFENSAVTLSPELNFSQLGDVIAKTPNKTMLHVHGRLKLMVNRNCIYKGYMGQSNQCKTLCNSTSHEIKDRMGEEFLLLTDNYCKSHIYNSKVLCSIEHIKEIMELNLDYILLDFVTESIEDASLAVAAYKEALTRAIDGDYTISKASKALIQSLKGNQTKGHLQRGVL